MSDIQNGKEVVHALYTALDATPAGESLPILNRFYAPSAMVRAVHPFHEMAGVEALAQGVWDPLRHALRPMQRRLDLFFAGRNEMDGFGSVWVASMGHLVGLFDTPWLGIAPTGKIALLRYAEFHKVTDGQITESALFFDIPHLMVQAGLQPFLPQTGAHVIQPPPLGQGSLLLDPQPDAEGAATLATINRMITDLGQWQSGLPLETELAHTWRDDMLWWGPTGIGATYTIERYAKQHAGPFRAAFSNRSPTKHLCRMAEGRFGGFFGWPNFTATHTGGFMGMPATGRAGDFRVIDFYRRAGDKLAENWVFIDLLHFWNQQGVDILTCTTGLKRN